MLSKCVLVRVMRTPTSVAPLAVGLSTCIFHMHLKYLGWLCYYLPLKLALLLEVSLHVILPTRIRHYLAIPQHSTIRSLLQNWPSTFSCSRFTHPELFSTYLGLSKTLNPIIVSLCAPNPIRKQPDHKMKWRTWTTQGIHSFTHSLIYSFPSSWPGFQRKGR